MESVLLNAAGHRRSPATMPGYHRGRPPRNKGEEYPADPPTIEEIVAVVRAVGDRSGGYRLRALEPRHHKHLSAGHRQQRDISTVHGRPSPTISASAGLQMRR
jgi:hypothetical protein